MKLVKYDAACKALAAASRIDEVKAIRNEAIRLKLYAKQANNKKAETDAAVIRDRATRKVGEMMEAQRKSVGLAKRPAGPGRGKVGSKADPTLLPTLREAGIDKHLADKARKLAELPEKVFEKAMSDARREQVPPTMKLINALADAAVDKILKDRPKPKKGKNVYGPKPKPSPLYDPWSKLSHAVRDIADQDLAQLAAIARQARLVGFLDIDLEHATQAVNSLAAWLKALKHEVKHGKETETQHGDSKADREGTRAPAGD